MLTNQQFNDLWTNPVPNGFGMPIATIPSYLEYVQREIYLQDYLDLFNPRGIISFPRVGLENGGLGVLVNAQIISIDYDYPWDEIERKKKRCITFIMIGEAPPPTIENYFYYGGADAVYTGYFNAPHTAFFNALPVGNKSNDLLQFADAGVLVIDLFPFAIKYTTAFRKDLILEYPAFTSTAKHFWGNPANPYSLHNRNQWILGAANICNEETKACLVIPQTICHYLAQIINENPPPGSILGAAFRIGFNTFIPPRAAIDHNAAGAFFINLPNGTVLEGDVGLHYALVGQNGAMLMRVPFYRCSCYSGAGTVPHTIFIKNALNLIP